MLRRNTVIVLVVFAILLAGVFYLQKNPAEKPEVDGTPKVKSASIFSFIKPDIEQAAFKDVIGTELVILKGEKPQEDENIQSWKILSPATQIDLVDNKSINKALKLLAAWKELLVIEVITNMELVGLQEPLYTIEIVLSTGSKANIKIGTQNVTRTGYYIQVDDGQPRLVATPDIEEVVGLIHTPPILLEPLPSATP
ncbi:MAG: DUF4340 domain-containing protein [Chloroflexota bacterium]